MFQLIMAIYRKLLNLDTFEEECDEWLGNLEDTIRKRMRENNQFIVYGAGRAGKYTIKYLKKHFPGIHIICVAVTTASDNLKNLEKIPVKQIDKLKKKV